MVSMSAVCRVYVNGVMQSGGVKVKQGGRIRGTRDTVRKASHESSQAIIEAIRQQGPRRVYQEMNRRLGKGSGNERLRWGWR